MIKVALAGNPNCGKTTLFNALTGATAHVGNWPGVTVDKREGLYKKLGEDIKIVDLPGIYSLSPYTPEEVISRNFIVEEKPDCVINIVDATNLERNLYLTTQLLEMDVPIVVALNMMDVIEKNGDKLDIEKLQNALGVPVVAISALKKQGSQELMLEALNAKKREPKTVLEGTKLKPLIDKITDELKQNEELDNVLYHSIKLIEEDEIEIKDHKLQVTMVEEFKKETKIDTEAMIADERYKYIEANYSVCLKKANEGKVRKSVKADRVLTHKVFGFLIFFAILFAIFHLTFSENFLFLGGLIDDDWVSFEGVPILEGILGEGAINSPGVIVTNLFNNCVEWLFGIIGGWFENSPTWLNSFVNDGLLAGLAAVLSFLPLIMILFLFMSILEDTGYMARVAFIFDKIFKKFGLSGRALMPMIMGFGCSVPAMANTRTLQNQNERTTTIRVIPFFSCGAKLPILTAIAGAIALRWGANADLITFSMYLLGITVAIIAIIIMRGTTMKGESQPFIMELPDYHKPSFKSTMHLLWHKLSHFIKKAFTIILASQILVWFLLNFTFDWQFIPAHEGVLDVDSSILAGFGHLLQPIFTPLGFGNQLGKNGWVFIVAAVSGLIAKENVISTFGTLAACLVGAAIDVEADGGVEAVTAMMTSTGITAAGLIAFIVFNMTTIPCFAAVATAKGESPDKRTYHFTLLFWIVASVLAATTIYLIGSWWWTTFIIIAVIALAIIIIKIINGKNKDDNNYKDGDLFDVSKNNSHHCCD
ncbi:MAG: ferrous iron transporter B [bacterium]|nr:ferrous iron transporter B [bacterium]